MLKNLNIINLERILIINLFIVQGYVSTSWKLAKLHPLLKFWQRPEADRIIPPYKFTECLGKRMKQIVAIRLEDFV